MQASWAVVATVDEPPPLVLAFVAHHLNEGARAVHLFLDQPEPELAEQLQAMPGCLVTCCDPGHWQVHNGGRRPNLHTRRQIINANIAYQTTTAEWLVHCDADEFIRDGHAMARELARAPADCDHFRLRVAERVMPADVVQTQIFEGIFRRPTPEPPGHLDPIYDAVALYLDRGLTGHPNGKAAVRVGRGHRLSIHQPFGEIPSRSLAATRLLHFDGLSRFHYMLKLLRRAYEKPQPGPPRHKPGRLIQLMALKEQAGDPLFLEELVSRLKTLQPEQVAALEQLGLIDDTPFSPNLGAMEIDLSVAGFDAALRARQAGFLQEIGFQG